MTKMPSCRQCGCESMEVRTGKPGYVCPACGATFGVLLFVGTDPDALKKIAPIIMRFRLTTEDWIRMMEKNLGSGKPDKALINMERFKTWLDEEVAPMCEALRQYVQRDEHEPLPEDVDIPDGPRGL